MEPERDIEKLLRAYAKRRRAKAGDAFTLHPATRRLLQGEVARQTPPAADEPESWSLWDVLRERWAALLGFALVIFFMASLVLPPLSKAKMKAGLPTTAASLPANGVAAPTAVAADRRLSAAPAELANNAVLAPAPAAALPAGDVASTLPVNGLAVNRTDDVSHDFSGGQSAARFQGELVAKALPTGAANSQRFVQAATDKSPPVLAAFAWQQNGNAIAVVDGDGSVYNGMLQLAESAATNRLTAATKKDLGVASNAPAATQNFSFRVTGANRSLQQSVVFAGNFVLLSNGPASSTPGFGGQVQQNFSNARITGTVTLGGTNRMQINALPVPP